MKYEIIEKTLKLDGKEIKFKYSIEKLVEFEDMYVLLLTENKLPHNNVIAIDRDGVILWHIEDIKKFPRLNIYVGLWKENDRQIGVISFSGFEMIIDVYTKEIIRHEMTK